MPAYNAAVTISATLELLLAQSFGDFELIISDNASTDGTRDIVENFARHDDRIRYECLPRNIGANLNYSHVFRAARGNYFKWASSSDWCAPTFLERCLAALRAHPDAVLAAPRTRLFEGEPSNFREYAFDIEILEETPSQRLRQLTSQLHLNNAMSGLIRSEALRQTRLVEAYFCADVVLMGHLALLGKMLRVEEPLYYRRMEPATSTALQGADGWRQHHYPTLNARLLLQASKRQLGWLRATTAAPMTLSERWRVYGHVARMIVRGRQELIDDLRGVVRYARYGFNRRH